MAQRPTATSRLYQASFVSGELHPALRARIDLEQYQRSLALCRNAFVRVYGGVANRPGTRFIDYTPGDHETRLIPFAFSDDQQLCLKLTDRNLRFFTGGLQLVAQPTLAAIGDAIGSSFGHWADESIGGSAIAFHAGGVALIGNPAGGGLAQAAQIVSTGSLDLVGVEHVLKFSVTPFPAYIRVGTGNSGDDLVPLRLLGTGFHSVAFTPVSSPNFFVQFLTDQGWSTSISFISFQGTGGPGGAVPLASATPWAQQHLRQLTWTQKADVLTIMHADYPVFEIRRYGTLSWSVVVKSFTPTIEAPVSSALAISGGGVGTTSYYYVVTYSTEGGEESFSSSQLTATGSDPLTATAPVIITIAQPLPVGVRQANVYRYRGGVYGYLTSIQAGNPQFRDDGSIVPKTDQTPPQFRNPFLDVGGYPAAGDYWEQRLAFGGSHNAPDQVDMSRPGAFNNFSKSVPTQDSDAISMVIAGKLVRRIRHLLGGKVLYIFTDGAVFAARRGSNGVTPAMEGGVAVELARGSTSCRVQAGETVLFVSRAGRAVQALAYDQGSDGFNKGEISQLSDHLLAVSPIQDWAWSETPHQLLWMVREDGRLLSCAFLDQEQVNGWSQHDTAGQFESVCSVREAGTDRVYVQTRRLLGGVFRRCMEHMALRQVADQRDGMFLDCGLSLDNPVAITAMIYDGGVVSIQALDHGLSEGDLCDIDQTGVSQLDDRRFRARVVGPHDLILLNHYGGDSFFSSAGLDPWLEGGVVRRCFSGVGGLQHLEGLEVMAVADGNVCGPFTVTGGQVHLPVPGSRVHVGLPYTTDLKLLKLAEAPDAFGVSRQVTHVQLQVESTRGVWIGPSFSGLTERMPRTNSGYPGDEPAEEWDQPANLRSGLIELPVTSRLGINGPICIRQQDPLPMEILGVLPVFTRSRGT